MSEETTGEGDTCFVVLSERLRIFLPFAGFDPVSCATACGKLPLGISSVGPTSIQ